MEKLFIKYQEKSKKLKNKISKRLITKRPKNQNHKAVKKQNQNQRKLKIIDTCDRLLIKWFFKILETSEYRYLIELDDYDQLPDITEKEFELLESAWDKITEEYDKLTGQFDFYESLMLINDDIKDVNKIQGLKSALLIIDINLKLAKETFEYFGVDTKGLKKQDLIRCVREMILKLKNAFDVQMIQRHKDKENAKDTDYYRTLIDLENGLNRNLDEERLTVKKWIYLIKSLKEKAERIKKLDKNGRST